VTSDSRRTVLAELRAYAPSDSREAAMRDRLVAFVAAHDDAFDRALEIGHVTASAWIVDPTRTRALLTHHRKLGKWLQLGGHVDGDPDVRGAALREAREESGLTSLRFIADAIYDLDVHPIPARPGEPAHDHYDVRFALEADPDEPLVVTAESKELAWLPIDALAEYGADDSVLRLARKTLPFAG
jgi:8-oxo-dGTP pyrophosphatase MutT (NUDIX family)